MKKISAVFLLAIGILVACTSREPANPKGREQASSIVQVDNHEILSKKELDKVFNELPLIKYKDLDASYQLYSDPQQKFIKKLKHSSYYEIKPEDLLKRVVGKFRVCDFVATDKYFEDLKQGEGKLYWLADKKMLYMFLEMIQQLKRKGYDEYAYTIRNSHRHPFWNANKWKGAKNSQHIYGRAVDLRVGDINRDGTANQKDKKILLDILEKIVGNKGGLGKYPGTMCLHFDSRGYRARWDKQ